MRKCLVTSGLSSSGGRQLLTGAPPFGTMGVATKHFVPRLNTELACFKLLVRRCRIEWFDGMCSQKNDPAGQRVI